MGRELWPARVIGENPNFVGLGGFTYEVYMAVPLYVHEMTLDSVRKLRSSCVRSGLDINGGPREGAAERRK